MLCSVNLTTADSACLFHFRCEGHQQGGGTAPSETTLPEPQHLHAEASCDLPYDYCIARAFSIPRLVDTKLFCSYLGWFSYRDVFLLDFCLQKLPVDFWPLTFFIESKNWKSPFYLLTWPYYNSNLSYSSSPKLNCCSSADKPACFTSGVRTLWLRLHHHIQHRCCNP